VKPAPFVYHRATSIEDAVAQLDDTDRIVRPLAGGQSLVPMLNLRLAPVNKLVDLGSIDVLKRAEEQGNRIHYGAMLPHAAFEDRLVPDGSNGLMPFVGGQIAYRAVRTRGTIGGAISLADPAADWLLTAVALEAEISIFGPQGRRVLSASEFVTGPYLTALDHAELIEAIVVPKRPKTERWGHYKATRKIGEYAESMAIILFEAESKKTRLVLGAVDGAPLVLEKSAAEISKGANAERLSLVIQHELAESDRGFSPSKLHLHRTVSLRAIQNAGLL
jgi:aerobic carbon-monoxide dehydrogenase medium subunit